MENTLTLGFELKIVDHALIIYHLDVQNGYAFVVSSLVIDTVMFLFILKERKFPILVCVCVQGRIKTTLTGGANIGPGETNIG